MNSWAILLLAQLGVPPRAAPPVLDFPEPGLDDTTAYQGYRTRFYRDAVGNTVQIYLDRRDGRVVHLLADADNASVGFTARDARGRGAALEWDGSRALVSSDGTRRTLEHRLAVAAPEVHVGHFLLGSMRVERDFQYEGAQRRPFRGPAYTVREADSLVAALARLPSAERTRHLARLASPDLAVLRARLRPRLTVRRADTSWVARVEQPALDARDTLVLELRVDPRIVAAARVGDSLSLRARRGARVSLTVRVSTTARPLTPLAREEIFTPDFLAFLAAARAAATGRPPGDSVVARYRWLERQATGVELLVSREKLMAGLPAYATYFGRDMLVSALMMRGVWRPEMSEFAIAAALHRLSDSGHVSHEEALGGQAIREGAAEYAALVASHERSRRAGDTLSARARLDDAYALLGDLRRVRENYGMIDDELQLPVLTARWLRDARVPDGRKRAFLLDAADGEPRLARLLRALAVVAEMAAPYARAPAASNLIAFPARDGGGWSAASWRDSGAGYAGGRWGMDVNAIWAPHAVAAVADILDAVGALGFSIDSLAASAPSLREGSALGRWVRSPAELRAARTTWRGAARHFLVRLAPDEVRSRVAGRLAALPARERDHWTAVLAATRADRDSLVFLALALDAAGRPIGVVNTDHATRLFLDATDGGGASEGAAAEVLEDVRPFLRHHPVGLFVAGLGPVAAADAYATPDVWAAFERDRYHGPRVVWGREVNLFLLGAAERIAAARAGGPLAPYEAELRDAVRRTLAAVNASGFRGELWSYDIDAGGRLRAVRYGTGSDVQLWSTTDLAVQFALARLGM